MSLQSVKELINTIRIEWRKNRNTGGRVADAMDGIVDYISEVESGLITKTSDLTNDGNGTYRFALINELNSVADALAEANIDIAGIYDLLENISLLTQSVTSSAEIDFSKNLTVINYTTATGDVALTTFVNLPAAPKVHSVFFRHNRATSLNVALRTASLTVGANTYTFTNMDATTVAVPAGKTLELSYMIIQNAANSFEIITKYSIQV